MKKNFFILCLFTLTNLIQGQDFVTFYMPGYQVAGFTAKDVSINAANSQIRSDVKGRISNILVKGDCIVQNVVFTADVSQMVPVLRNIFHYKKSNFYGSAFDSRIGGVFKLNGSIKVGAAFDLGFKGIQYYNTDVAMEYNYTTMGVTFISLHSFQKKIYLMPKLSFDPVFSKHTDKPIDGLSTKFEVSVGYKLLNKLGFSISTGVEHLKINYETKVDKVKTFKSSKFMLYYLQFGLAFMLN